MLHEKVDLQVWELGVLLFAMIPITWVIEECVDILRAVRWREVVGSLLATVDRWARG